jgi:P4 family phage/plasmid primase-like protien
MSYVKTDVNQVTNIFKQSPDAQHLYVANAADEPVENSIAINAQVTDLENIAYGPIPSLNADHFHDAQTILNHFFKDKLVCLEKELYFFNGRELKTVEDRAIRKIIGTAMSGSGLKVTQARIAGTYAVLKDQVPEYGRPDPVNFKVFFANGVYDLKTRTLSAHNISNRNTRTLSACYNENAKCPKFLAWLRTIFSTELCRIGFLQQLIGWTFCRHNQGIEKAIMFLGPPRAGKGVILSILRRLHGQGATSLLLSELNDDKRLSAMRNAHVGIDSDAVGPTIKNADTVMGLFKVITSNEPLAIKLLYVQNPLDGALNCKLIIAANSAPVMFDNSAATANRWLPLVFDRSFLGSEDTNLLASFEDEMEGIAIWALDGLKELMNAKSFKLPPSSKNQLDLLTLESGTLSDFVDDALIINGLHRCSDEELWQSYVIWATTNGHKLGKRAETLKAVEDTLRSSNVVRKKSILMKDGKSKRGFTGISPKKTTGTNNLSPLACPTKD